MENNNASHKLSWAHVLSSKCISKLQGYPWILLPFFIFLFSLCARKIVTLIKRALTISFTEVLHRRVKITPRTLPHSVWSLDQASMGRGNTDLGICGTDRKFWRLLSVPMDISLSLHNQASGPRQITSVCLPGLSDLKGLFHPNWLILWCYSFSGCRCHTLISVKNGRK